MKRRNLRLVSVSYLPSIRYSIRTQCSYYQPRNWWQKWATWMSRGSETPCRCVLLAQSLLNTASWASVTDSVEVCWPLRREELRSSNELIEITIHAQLVPLKMIANCGLFCCWLLRGSKADLKVLEWPYPSTTGISNEERYKHINSKTRHCLLQLTEIIHSNLTRFVTNS